MGVHRRLYIPITFSQHIIGPKLMLVDAINLFIHESTRGYRDIILRSSRRLHEKKWNLQAATLAIVSSSNPPCFPYPRAFVHTTFTV